jgi:prepilin-type N-terminal cleavage/methylation domain-containing protein
VATCKRTDPRRRRGGFTLIEVLIAIVILAVGLLALEAMGIGAARAVARAGESSEYTALATDKMERALNLARQGQTPPPEDVVLDGARVQTSTVVTAAGTRNLYTVTVTVTPPANRGWTLAPITVVGREVR